MARRRRAPEGPASTTPPPPADGGVPLADLLASLRPPAETVRRFVERGDWRAQTVLHDLYRGAARHPHRPAVVAHRAGRPAAGRVLCMSYAQLAAYTDRFAHALDALGVRPGDPVAFQLPNRWETCALLLACLRTGAVAVPLMAGYGARDLEAVLSAAQPRVCVVPDQWEGTTPAQVLADLAPALPWLRHRVVLGNAAPTGAVDFVRHFVRTPHERYRRTGWLPLPPDPADRICLAVTTLGLHAAHSMAMHTPNSLYASVGRAAEGGPAFSTLPLAALPSLLHAVIGPLSRGSTVVLQDIWDPQAALDLMAAAGARQVVATPAQWAELAALQEQRPRGVGELRKALASDPTGTSPRLVRRVHESLGVPLSTLSGTPSPDGESELPPAAYGSHGRGPASPVAVWRRETGGLRLTWDQPLSTDTANLLSLGDEDHSTTRGEEVGGVFLIPVTEVEERLLTHPQVAEAAVVACTDPEHGELACAAVVPVGAPPSLLALREHLIAQGTLPAHLPARLELMGALPRTDAGELRRRELEEVVARRVGAAM